MRGFIKGQIGVDQVLAFTFGTFFCILLLVFAVAVPNPTLQTFFVFRVVLALAAAGVGAVLPGLFAIQLPGIRAGGALGLAAMVFFVNPPALVKDPVERKVEQALNQSYAFIVKENFQLAHDFLDKSKILEKEPLEVPFSLAS
jgi:hypothetical protein